MGEICVRERERKWGGGGGEELLFLNYIIAGNKTFDESYVNIYNFLIYKSVKIKSVLYWYHKYLIYDNWMTAAFRVDQGD